MTVRSFCRVFRWAGLAAVAPVLWACNARSLERPALKPDSTFGKTFQQTINRNVDMLFLVDDSSSMRLSQDNLRRNFPVFMQRLMDPPGLPNIHVAVVSSDMGAGDGSIGECDMERRSARDLPVHAHDATVGAADLHGQSQPGEKFIRQHRRPGELHRQSRRDVLLHGGALGGRLRL